MRYWVAAGAGPEGVEELGDLAEPGRIEGAGRGGVDQLLEPAVQEGGPVPQRGAALVGQQVHGHRPAVPLLARGCGRRGRRTSSKKTSENSSLPCMVRDRAHGDARGVHVDEEGGDPPVGGVGRPGPGEEHAALGVLGQAGPDLLPGDLPAAVGALRPAGQRGQVAPGARARRTPGTRSRPPGGGRAPWRRPARAGRSRSWWGPGPRSSSRARARPGPGRSAPRPGRRASGSNRRVRPPARATRSASSRRRRSGA